MKGGEAATIVYAVRALKIRRSIVLATLTDEPVSVLLHGEKRGGLPVVCTYFEYAGATGRIMAESYE